MAARARKPGIVFTDRRFRNVLEPPDGIIQAPYDPQELPYGTTAPTWRRLHAAFATFFADHDQAAAGPAGPRFEDGRVGVLVGDQDPDASAVVEALLTVRTLTPARLDRAMSSAFLREARRCDWVIVDTADPAVEVLATFLHGQAVPLLRLRHTSAGDVTAADDVLFGDLPIGYRKDVVRWATTAELQAGLGERLEVVTEEPHYLGDHATAERYFASAALRAEPVFLSYAGEDDAPGAEFSALLRRRFTDVFDYRDRSRRHLPVGEPWMDSLYRRLGSSAVGVILHSRHYRDSAYCRDEERLLYDRSLNGRLKLLVVKLDATDVPLPLGTLQYENVRNTAPEEIVDRFVDALGPAPTASAGPRA